LTLTSDPSKDLLRPRGILMQHDPKDDLSDSMLGPFLPAKSESISDDFGTQMGECGITIGVRLAILRFFNSTARSAHSQK
jgi:hypothetical protein